MREGRKMECIEWKVQVNIEEQTHDVPPSKEIKRRRQSRPPRVGLQVCTFPREIVFQRAP